MKQSAAEPLFSLALTSIGAGLIKMTGEGEKRKERERVIKWCLVHALVSAHCHCPQYQ